MLRVFVCLFIVALLFSYGWGKKGPPTLKDYPGNNYAGKNLTEKKDR